jgi:2,4-dienoyl-CoA reductase-like NADH-dependent reductase (Old Yellow Enzyme family)
VLNANKSAIVAGGYATELVYELLDAHVDTMRMARELDADPEWAAHLDYLRGLQRVGREALARAAT